MDIKELVGVSKVSDKAKIGVVGGGSWATAIVKMLCEDNSRISIRWWFKDQEDVNHIERYHHNPRYLSAVNIDPEKVKATSNLLEAIEGSEYIILVVPAAFVAEVLKGVPNDALQGKTIVSAIKGMIPEENLLITEYVEKHFGVLPEMECVIAGPCHAEEVAMERRSYLTIASPNKSLAKRFAKLLECRFINVATSEDVYGIEYAAVMKNIYAIACGIAHGLNYGDNFQAVLVSYAMTEKKRFLKAWYPLKRKMNESAYLGDLLVTAYSQFSRNRTFGNMIGRGYSVRSAQMEMEMIAEGYYAVKCVKEICEAKGVNMPIMKAVYNILYERISPVVEFKILENHLK